MELREDEIVEAEVVEVTPEGVFLLYRGIRGLLPPEEGISGLRPGQRLVVKVVGFREDGLPVFSCQVSEWERELFEARRQASRLRDRLQGRVFTPPKTRAVEERIETRLERWLQEAERALERLRRHRQKRLSTKFYTD